MEFGPFAVEHVAPVVKTWGEVWSLWWSGESIHRSWMLPGIFGGLHAVYWWIRWGCFLQFVSVGLIVIEVVGEKRLRAWAEKLHNLINFDKIVRVCFLSIRVLYLKMGFIVRDLVTRIVVITSTLCDDGPSDEVFRRCKANKVCVRLAWFTKRIRRDIRRRHRKSRITRAYNTDKLDEDFRIAEKLGAAVLFVGLACILVEYGEPLKPMTEVTPLQTVNPKVYVFILIWCLISPIAACAVIIAFAFLFTAVDALIELFASSLENPYRDTLLKGITVVFVIVGFVWTMMDV